MGECLYVPEETEAAGTDTALGAGTAGANAIVVARAKAGADSPMVPCPTS
jgi:hypothetical protein